MSGPSSAALSKAIKILLDDIGYDDSQQIVADTETDFIDAQSIALTTIKKGLVYEVESQVARIHRRRNCLVPISMLPNEVIDAIFVAYFDAGHPATIKNLWTLAQVSYTWWKRVISTPSLWTHLDVEHSIGAIETHLMRSREVPFNFILQVGSDSVNVRRFVKDRSWLSRIPNGDLAALVEPVMKHRRRWKEFKCIGPFLKNFEESLKSCLAEEHPTLEKLTVGSVRFSSATTFVELAGGPRLRSVDLSVFSQPVRLSLPGFKSVTDLRLRHLPFTEGIGTVWTLIDALCGQLETLSLDGVGIRMPTATTTMLGAPILFPHLKSLVVSKTEIVYPAMHRFRTPVLEKLVCAFESLRPPDMTQEAIDAETPLLQCLVDPPSEHSPFVVAFCSLPDINVQLGLSQPQPFHHHPMPLNAGPPRIISFYAATTQELEPLHRRRAGAPTPQITMIGDLWSEVIQRAAVSPHRVFERPLHLKLFPPGTHDVLPYLPHILSLEISAPQQAHTQLDLLWRSPESDILRPDLERITLLPMGVPLGAEHAVNETIHAVQRMLERRRQCLAPHYPQIPELVIRYRSSTFHEETATFVPDAHTAPPLANGLPAVQGVNVNVDGLQWHFANDFAASFGVNMNMN